jgi:hypothetical protein
MEAAETQLGPSQWEIYFPKLEPQGYKRYCISTIHAGSQLLYRAIPGGPEKRDRWRIID